VHQVTSQLGGQHKQHMLGPKFRELTSTEQELLLILKQGEKICKVSKSGRTPKFRKFWVTEDLDYLCWERDRKAFEKCRVAFCAVFEVLEGQQTTTFRNNKDLSQYENNSLSLVTEKKSFDLICNDMMQTQTWIKGLKLLVERAHAINAQNQNTYPGRKNTIRERLSIIGDRLKVHRPSSLVSTSEQTTQPSNPSPNSSTVTSPQITSIKSKPVNDKRHTSPHRNTYSMSSFDMSTPLTSEVVRTGSATPFGITLKKTGDLETLVRKDISKELPPVPIKQSPTNAPITSNNPSPNTKQVPVEEKFLFEFVVVVKLESINGGAVDPNSAPRVQYDADQLPVATMNPVITYSFPPSNVQKKENKNLMVSIPSFCFPDIDLVEPLSTLESKTYSFVLTDLDGSRRFGYCKRMLPPGTGKRWPETYCIISAHPCFELFNNILNQVETRNHINSVSVFAFLKTVLARPFPERGNVITIKAENPSTGKFEDIKLERPNSTDPMLEHIDFKPLFTHLQKIENVISVFSSILLEKRLIFFSNDISVLSSVTHAFTALIYPFTWQHVFIPVLPRSLLDYVCSPVPFVVGVLSIYRKIVDTMPMEEVIYVDLDSDKIIGQDDRKIFPETDRKITEKALKQIIIREKGKPIRLDNKQVAEIFLQFFLRNFGDYRKYMIDSKKTNDKIFDSSGFIKNKPKSSKKFFDIFQQSQMFERWTFDREEVYKKELAEGTPQDAFEISSLKMC
jgi:hypothetical protein